MTNRSRRAPGPDAADPAGAMRRLAAWLEDNDAGVRPYFNYSGRGMFGATCFGLVGGLGDIQAALMDFAADNPGLQTVVRQLVQAQRRDQMGRDMIVYFPGVDIPSE